MYVRVLYSFLCCCCFFFKQKTAYELLISDWSSDVCSSDLDHRRPALFARRCGKGACRSRSRAHDGVEPADSRASIDSSRLLEGSMFLPEPRRSGESAIGPNARSSMSRGPPRSSGFPALRCRYAHRRSEEHTSELQSLMRISYAVFCLKKNNKP